MRVLDTDVLSIIQRGPSDRRFKSLLRILADAQDDVYVTVISLDEQLHGAFNEIQNTDSKIRIRGYRRLRDITEDFNQRPVLDYDAAADSIYDKLKGLKGRPATKDLRIAAIVLSHDATLITGNPSAFSRIPGLKIEAIR